VTSALDVNFNAMRYINLRFTYLLNLLRSIYCSLAYRSINQHQRKACS